MQRANCAWPELEAPQNKTSRLDFKDEAFVAMGRCGKRPKRSDRRKKEGVFPSKTSDGSRIHVIHLYAAHGRNTGLGELDPGFLLVESRRLDVRDNSIFDAGVRSLSIFSPGGGEAAAAGNRYGGPRNAASSPAVRFTDQCDFPEFHGCLKEASAPFWMEDAAASRSRRCRDGPNSGAVLLWSTLPGRDLRRTQQNLQVL